jgi:WD40-like Beta Propeller Repeat
MSVWSAYRKVTQVRIFWEYQRAPVCPLRHLSLRRGSARRGSGGPRNGFDRHAGYGRRLRRVPRSHRQCPEPEEFRGGSCRQTGYAFRDSHALCRHQTRSVRDHRANWRWRHGRGPQGPRHPPQPPASWSLDGRFILLTTIGASNTLLNIDVLQMYGERRAVPFVQTQYSESQATFSPDGHWVAYTSNESGRNEVYVRSFTPPGSAASSAGARAKVSRDGGNSPVWRRDGREPIFRSASPLLWLRTSR